MMSITNQALFRCLDIWVTIFIHRAGGTLVPDAAVPLLGKELDSLGDQFDESVPIAKHWLQRFSEKEVRIELFPAHPFNKAMLSLFRRHRTELDELGQGMLARIERFCV